MKKYFTFFKFTLIAFVILVASKQSNAQVTYSLETLHDASGPYDIVTTVTVNSVTANSDNYLYGFNVSANYTITQKISGTLTSMPYYALSYNSNYTLFLNFSNGQASNTFQVTTMPITLGTQVVNGNSNGNYYSGSISGLSSNGTYTDPNIISAIYRNVQITVSTNDGGLSNATASSVSGSVLPITFSSVNASLAGDNTVNVAWSTATEENASFYNIERSANASSWTSIGKVSSQVVGGNSTTALNYNFIDEYALSGTSYYRIKETDLDGHSYYSSIVKVNNTNTLNSNVRLFPNPASNKLNIVGVTSDNETIVVYNILGSKVLQQNVNANFNGSIDISSLPSGQYVLQIGGKGYKFVVSN